MHMTADPAIPPSGPLSLHEWFDSRAGLRQMFLAQCKWPAGALEPVGEDCAFRRYFRLRNRERSVILMESVPTGAVMATPGHNLVDFIRIAAWLRGHGLNAPEIYEADEKNGYILMEDFGDLSFKKAMEQGADRAGLYRLGTDVLIDLHGIDAAGLALPSYYQSHVHAGRRRVVDWYMPAVLRRKNPEGLAADYLAVWSAIEKNLPSCPQGFLHIDYHVENLMWLPDRKGPQRCGLLDFQGAMTGPVPYDLVNLLEDARMDIPGAIRRAMLERFCAALTPQDRAAFRSWYRVLATQFHCRVIGQFIRLALRDNKTRYLQNLPRLSAYIAQGLEYPLLAPLKEWFSAQGVDFKKVPAIDADRLRSLIRPDAF
jgi:N-acetylmuramate 1-kinase